MLSLQEGKNRIALKAISLVIVQVFLATSLVYPSSIKDMAAIYKLNSKLRVPLANSEEEKSWFSSRFLDKTNEQSSDRKSNASFPLRGEYSRRRSPKYILASLIDMLVGNPANTLSDSELNKNLEDFKASFLEKIPVSDRPAYLKEMVNYLSAQAIRFRSSFPEVEKLRQRFERYINNSRKIMADAGDTVLKKDIKTQEVINRFEEKGGDYYKKAIDHFKDSKTDKGTQFIDLGTPARLTRVYEVIEHYGGELKTKNILDIGCSYGLFLHILKGLGIEASGLDQDEDFVEYGKNDGLDIRKSDITEKDIPVDERFDITTSVYVLDHISLNDQDAFLRTFNNIFDLTKDEGLSIHYLSEDKYTFFEKNLDKLESYLLDRIFVDGGVILVFRKPAQGDMTLASAEDRQVDHTFSGSGDSEATRIGSLSAGEMAQEIWREAETRGEALPETRLSHLKESFERFFGTMPAIRLLSQEIMSGFGARSEPVIRYGNNIVISKEYYDENGFANAVTDEEALAAAGEGRAIMDPLLNILAHEQVASVAEEKGVLSDELPMLAEGVLNEADHETRRQAHLGGGVDQAFRGRKKKDTRIPADFADKTWLRKMIEEERAKHGPKEAKKISRRDVLKFMAGIGAVAATGRIAYELGEAPKDIKEEHEYLMQSLHENFYDTMSHFSAQVRYLETSRSTKKNLLSREDMARVENFLSPSRVDAIRFAAKEYDLEPELIVGFVYEEETYQNSENRIKKVVKEFLSRVGGELDMRNTAGIGNTSAIYMLEDRSFLDTVYENKEFFLKLLKDRGAISVFNQFIDAYKEIIEIRYEPSWKAYIQNDAGVFISLVDRVEPVGILYAAYIMRKDANEIHERNRNETKIPDTSVMAGHSRHWTLRDRKEDYKPIPDVYNERYKRAFNQSYYPPYCYQYFVAADYTGIIVSRRGQARARGKIKAYLMFLRSSIFKAYDEQERLREIEQKEKKPPAPIKRKIDTKETRKLASRQKDKGPSRKFWNLRRKAALGVVALSLAGAKLPGVIPGEIAPRSEVRIEQGIVEDDKSERQIQKDVRACLEIIFDLPEEYITGWEKDKSFEEQNSYSKFIYTVLQDLKQDIESGKVEVHPLDRFILGLAGLLEIHGNTIVIKVPSGIITSGKIEPYGSFSGFNDNT
ncbi:MAG: class I SAM-dependent methyltransferase [Candidatus Omnitrophica bacterium]|nr:class I SAM-dependent methyltransferase [Candidatus Omnitrophota bacterium]